VSKENRDYIYRVSKENRDYIYRVSKENRDYPCFGKHFQNFVTLGF